MVNGEEPGPRPQEKGRRALVARVFRSQREAGVHWPSKNEGISGPPKDRSLHKAKGAGAGAVAVAVAVTVRE